MNSNNHLLYRLRVRACTMSSVFMLGCAASILGPVCSEGATDDLSIKQLRRRLDEQIAVTRDLQRKLDALIDRVGNGQRQPPASQPPASVKDAQAQAEPQSAPAAPPAANGGNGRNGTNGTRNGGAQVSATKEEAERALERTLTVTGALLLPYGAFEAQPTFSYVRRTNTLSFTNVNGVATPFDQDVKRNEFQPSVSARLGLPFDAELEASLPYNITEQENVTAVGPSGRMAQSNTGSGIGDFSVGLAKTVLREKNWWPDLITRVTWDTGSGDPKSNGVTLNGGFSSIAGEIVALKRQDPLAFTASASYRKTFENNNFEPGNDLSFSLGAFLATSPDTSLQMSLEQQFVDDSKFRGRVVKASDQVASTLNLGVSSILDQNILLQIVGGVGLTEDAPDYSITVALPIRFPVPVPRLGQ